MDDLITFLRVRLRDVIAQLSNGWTMTAFSLVVEVESKRQILDYFEAWLSSAHRLSATEATVVTEIARRVIAKLAMPFASHPDYRKEWRI